MKTILAAVCGSVCLLSVSSAKADITLCNNYSSQIWVAVGLPFFNDILNCGGRFNTDEMIGWYSMTPGNCTTVIGGCVDADLVNILATAADGAYWAGSFDYGNLSYSAFDFCYNTTTCAANQCPSFDYGPAGLRGVHVDDGCGFWGQGYAGTIDLN